MAKGYWIVNIDVKDEKNYPAYLAATKPAIEEYGANFLVRGGEHQVREGTAYPRNVVIEFESYEKAIACYESPEYAPAMALRHQYAVTNLVIVKGAE
jgi:uncharacterized protein (DUF1330 family)